MSNFAALISPLSISGSLKADGTPNVNGIVWCYVPGTTNPATVYADAAATVAVPQPITLDSGGRFPYATFPNGIYTLQPIRLLIQDSTAITVSDTVFESGAGSTGLDNAGFTGTTVDEALTAIYESLAGPDGTYLAYAGGTALSLQKYLRSVVLTPQSFGALGDGNNDDTNAIQAAINKLKAVGGGVLFFPPGTYNISVVLTFPAASSGITLAGAGPGATVISQSSTADVFSSTNATDITIANMSVSGNIGLTGASRLIMRKVVQSHVNSSSAYGLSLSGCSIVALEDCIFGCATGQSVVSISGASGSIYLSRCRLGGAGTFNCIDIAGSSSSIFVDGTLFNGTSGVTGVKFESGYTGTGIYLTNCPTLGGNATPVDASAVSNIDPGVYQRNCGMDFILQDNLIADAGHTVTPNPLYVTSELRATSASGGASITVGTPSPNAASTKKGATFTTYHVNASGSGVTWVFPAGAGQYITAVTPPTGNGTRFSMTWMWDGSNWDLRSSGQAA